ncbi:hypothetical protein [Fructilactobacillus fructivorans]|uniref:Uncharacterized protein n=1 Tax=Fructilactobacillus fructivorans TaxID=1614 RepID=A0A0C1M559_9LACO|nr:hypothetical protein [Fructilactobacillus fructivorans]KID41329.1 hypothetical protein LfDm3_0995 [Fructilactobacillus fructivorans]KRK57049.1 hypothetical protein FC73_GL001087 [Fructilactobacillus fructivorans]KRN12244.1 hypothetical protein IV37_GL001473 [Fructilactobacillus fructivorans]KRN39738.1 hypothetical protein IV51_GL000749 [Fructilactobacillus fructivorans]KRN42711.1 hypothetical protein IV48_GL001298 [Fructilactobacillus fructivorans]
MSKNKDDFTKLLNQLKDGEIKDLTINPKDFPEFQQAFMNFPTRKRIVGKASEKGILTYHYSSEN